jgi:methionine sulfoxide reductase heme-binding subunit
MKNLVTRKPLLLIVHIASWGPLIWILWDWATGGLTFNPIQDVTLRTGKTALVLLVLSLACTPINSLFGLRQVIPLRKWLGLYSFFYASGHVFIFIGLDYGFNPGYIYEAIIEKRYALAGAAAFLLLLPLAITSTRGWMKRLGKKWKKLHRLVYVAGLMAVIHYVWLVKSDIRVPLLYAGIVVLLLIGRLPRVRKLLSRYRSSLKKASGQFARRTQRLKPHS